MAGSDWGTLLKLSTWGESHGPAIGAVLDGFPAGMELCEKDIQPFLDRRRPGGSILATGRKEQDQVEILSGVFEGKTTGAPISLIIRNYDQRSGDYGQIRNIYRPGHADYTYDQKYGIRDYRGGGRSSGRETAARVAAGAIAVKLLREMGIEFCCYTESIGPVHICSEHFDRKLLHMLPTGMPDRQANDEALIYMKKCIQERDSSGGCICCRIQGVPAGIGDPVFQKLDARLAGALMSIGAVKAVEIGDGAASSFRRGSENNDGFENAGGHIRKTSNHAGGILGGISDGDEIILRIFLKPVPSIAQIQKTVDCQGEMIETEIGGRHDPVIVPRAVVVAEAMCALTILDSMMVNMSSRRESLLHFYRK